jgi:hypothetical protein
MRPGLIFLSCCLALAAVACGDDDGGGGDADAAVEPLWQPECNPLGYAGCVAPFPSSLHLIEDTSTATGYRLDIPRGAFPDNGDGIELDPDPFNQRDGFSPAVHLYTVFEGGVDPSALTAPGDYAAGLEPGSSTVIIDMATGERVAHFAEVDANTDTWAVVPEDYDQQALYLRPATRLAPATRYAVGVRTSLKARGGGELPVPPGFQAILDGTVTEHERLERVRPRYADIFAAFEAQGIDRSELVVAWDFVTASDATFHGPLLSARDAALAAMGTDAANMTFTVDSDAPVGDGTQIARKVLGTYQSPWVLTGERGTGGLNFDDAGVVRTEGTMDAEFIAMVPACAADATEPLPVIVFGHGFFGDLSETGGSYMRRVAQELCMVVVGTVWYGMSIDDIDYAALALNNANNVITFGQRMIQGMVNQFTLVQLVRGKLSTELLVDDQDQPLVDTSKIYFYGISQGHILGSTFMAYDPVIEKAVLAVGGANWTLLFERSTHWATYGLIIRGAYPGPLNMIMVESLLQFGMDYIDPIHLAHRFYDDPIPGTPQKQLLLHEATGDTQVTNLATELQARTLGLPVLGPAVRVPFGFTEATGPLTDALVIYDEKPTPLPHESNLLNEASNDTHGNLRKRQAVVDQIRTFYATGEIVHTCGDGQPCDCTVNNACGPAE